MKKTPTFRPNLETLEDRLVPALVAGQLSIASLPALNLTPVQVTQLLQCAAAATSTDNAIVAVVDREGNILGVKVEGGVSSAVTPTASLVSGGSGYSVGNVLTLVGGTYTHQAQLAVTSIGAGGTITGFNLTQFGNYTTAPTNPVGVTGGSGNSAMFNFNPNTNLLDFSIDGAVAEARTAAMFSSNADPVTSRTIQEISQSTITQREVDSYTFISDPSSTSGGPGLVAPIGIAGHFPPNINDTPQVDLFGIETTNRTMLVNSTTGTLFTPGGGGSAGTDVSLQSPYNINPANVPAGQAVNAQLSYYDTLLGASATIAAAGTGYKPYDVLTTTSGGFNAPAQITVLTVNGSGAIQTFDITEQGQNATALSGVTVSGGHGTGAKFNFTADNQNNAAIPHMASRGIGTLPGGVPLYEDGVLVGAIGVFFPGTTGFADAENSKLSSNYNPNAPDLSMEAEFIALAAAGGSKGAGFPIGTLGNVAALPGFDLPFSRIDLVGVTLDGVGPGGQQGPQNLVNYVKAHFSVGTGNPNSGVNVAVDAAGQSSVIGIQPPTGWLVTPHAGGGMTAAEVTQIIDQGINQANAIRSQLRPLGSTTRMIFAVTDSAGDVLGLYRMPDAPTFSIDVAISKARDVAYYDDASQVAPVDQLAGIPAGTAFTARTFRYLALPHFPEGINSAPPGPWSILNDPGTNSSNGLASGPALPISAFNSVFGYDAFHPNTTFQQAGANASGIVFFPGSSAVYVKGKIVGGFGVSGDGVDEDDVVTQLGINGFGPPTGLDADNFFFRGVRLPYSKFDRNPEG